MIFFGFKDFAIGLALIPFSLFLAFNPKSDFDVRHDYSYGIYIYSAPVTQLLILIFPDLRSNWILLAITCCIGSFFFALLSWHFVEKPALKLKNKHSLKNPIGRVL
jgi:peptidoglycan/LPS O-acetylase OafA/YrhL